MINNKNKKGDLRGWASDFSGRVLLKGIQLHARSASTGQGTIRGKRGLYSLHDGSDCEESRASSRGKVA